jgi:C4-dicarboxylate-binding protein DctP
MMGKLATNALILIKRRPRVMPKKISCLIFVNSPASGTTQTIYKHGASAKDSASTGLGQRSAVNTTVTGKGNVMRRTIIAIAAGALALVSPASAQSPVVIKFSHVVAHDTPKGLAAEKFKELAEKYTNGRAKIEVYANSALYKDKEEVEALQLGAVQMLAPSLSKFGPLGVREFEVFDLPYIFPTKEALRRITEGPLGKKLLAKLGPKGITGLAYWDNGFKIISANRPLHRPEDVGGLKMRIQSSKVLEAQMRALGAIPQVMAFSDVYQALQTGVVDGTENPPSNMYTQKMHEVQKHATITNHGYVGYAVIVNKRFWDGLPADVRQGLEKAMAEATAYANGISDRENEQAMVEMRNSGRTTFYEPTAAEQAAWRKALAPVAEEMASRVSKGVIEEFRKEAVTN